MKKNINILRKILLIVITIFIFVFIGPLRYSSANETGQKFFEFRGAWIATVQNIDIEKQFSSDNAGISAYKQQFLNILDVFEEYKLNVVIFQVRPLNDAFYVSEINPWSRFLIGKEGTDPGWDPLAWMVEETHKRNMEFHAWMNPYRTSLDVVPKQGDYEAAKTAYLATLDDKNFAKQNPDLLVRGTHDNTLNTARLLLNPSREEVRQHIYDTIDEVIRNYDVDAIHFDDYFYNGVGDNEDNGDYNIYRQKGGTLAKADWRREQVNILIEGIHDLMEDLNRDLGRHVELGISPAGVWAPGPTCPAPYGQPGGMEGILCYSYSSYVDLFADTRKWVREEWIDYILPQNYGSFYDQNHRHITSWWADEVRNKDVKLYIGLAPYQYVNSKWEISNMSDQMDWGDSFDTVDGYAMYNISSLKTAGNQNMKVALNNLKDRWSEPAFLPIKTKNVEEYGQPEVTVSRGNFTSSLTFAPNDFAYAYAVYQVEKGKPFNIGTAKKTDVVYNYPQGISISYPVERDKAYDYYIKTLYYDGYYKGALKTVSVDVYNKNAPPVIKNVKLGADLLVFEGKMWLNISGEVFDADGDDLTIIIQINNKVLNEVKLKNITDKFSYDQYIPDLTFNRSYFNISVSDGIQTVKGKTLPFYVPAHNYPFVMRYIMTMEIMINGMIEGIYK